MSMIKFSELYEVLPDYGFSMTESCVSNLYLQNIPEDYPSINELMDLKQGDLVKVSHNMERIWVKVLYKEDKKILGLITNHLIQRHPFRHSDIVKFTFNHVYAVISV